MFGMIFGFAYQYVYLQNQMHVLYLLIVTNTVDGKNNYFWYLIGQWIQS